MNCRAKHAGMAFELYIVVTNAQHLINVSFTERVILKCLTSKLKLNIV